MNCEKCNETISENANFCSNCGVSLKSDENSSGHIDHLSDILNRNEENGTSNNNDFVILSIAVIFIFIVIILSFIALLPNEEASVNFAEGGCWTGVFNDGKAEMNIEGCESKSYECEVDEDCGIYALILSYSSEDDRSPLCLELGEKKVCTTTEYGYVSINLNLVRQD